MRVALFCGGSRGDSEPLVALAQELRAHGDEPVLVTWEKEHTRLGFAAHTWDEAFSLPLRFGRGRAAPRPGVVHALLLRLASFVPRILGRTEAVGALRGMQASDLAREALLGLPILCWTWILVVVHFLTFPLALLVSASARRAWRGRPPLKWPSAIDIVMLVDGALRREWRDSTPHSRALLDRAFAQLLRIHSVPDALFDFIDRVLARADIVVVAEGGDDPMRERLVLFLAERRKLTCIRASFFPRDLIPSDQRLAWPLASCFPILLPWLSRKGGARRRLSFSAARLLCALLGVVAWIYDAWHAAITRVFFGGASLVDVINRWLAAKGEAGVTWEDVLRPDYARAPRLEAWSPSIAGDTHSLGCWRGIPPENWQPPQALEAFCGQPGQLLYVSRVARSVGFLQALLDASVRLPDLRILVNLPPDEVSPELRSRAGVFCINSVPHDWLFERIDAAVVHGGAGTVAAVLGAGVPTLGVATWGDQSLWAERLHALGAGPEPLHVRWITADGLAHGISECLNKPIWREGARAARARLRVERGLEAARLQLHASLEDRLEQSAI